MKVVVLAVLLVCVFKSTTSCCCREPCVLQKPCYCGEVYSGVVTCCTPYEPTSTSLCSCGLPSCCCFRDTCNPCACCCDKTSPVCSCFAALAGDDDGCSCGCGCGCGCGGRKKSYVYFPEVEYPCTVIEMNPFFFTNCWNY